MKTLIALAVLLTLSGCATTFAIVDTAGAAVVYTTAAVVKTTYNVGEFVVCTALCDDSDD